MIPHGRRPAAGFTPPPPTLSLFPTELSRDLRVDSVSRLAPPPPRLIAESAPVAAAVELMRRERIGCLLVTRAGRVVGLFTERDLLTRILSAGRSLATPMGGCMTPDPVTVHPKDPVRTAIKRMEAGGYRHLPVVDDAGRPVGVLSAKRVVRYLVEHFPGLVHNQPPRPHQYPEMAEGA